MGRRAFSPTALLCLLALLSAAYAGEQGTCGTLQYNKCQKACCKGNTAVDLPTSNKGLIPSCCGDATADRSACSGNGVVSACCTVHCTGTDCATTSAVDTTKIYGGEQARSCFDKATYGCCRVRVWNPDLATPTYQYSVSTYDMRSTDCCWDALTYAGSNWNGVVPKGQSCGVSPGVNAERARCEGDADCTALTINHRGSGYKCCRTSKYSGQSDAEFNSNDYMGRCYDPGTSSAKWLGCCGGSDAPYEVDLVNDDGTNQVNTYNKPAMPFAFRTHRCCLLGKGVVPMTEGCPCMADGECTTGHGTGSVCCFASGDMSSPATCSAKCGMADGATGCVGKCTVQKQKWDGSWGWQQCIKTCGPVHTLNQDPDVRGHEGCCSTTFMNKKDVAFYDKRTQVCCPKGNKAQTGWIEPASWMEGSDTATVCMCHADSDCPGAFKCCAPVTSTAEAPKGQCYDPTLHSCCNVPTLTDVSKMLFNPKKQVCCPVNGPADNYRGCSCSANSDCPTKGSCCIDKFSHQQHGKIPLTAGCKDGKNCEGKCVYDPVDECCDNPWIREKASDIKVCKKEYEKCCAGECCNEATQICKKRAFTPGPNPEPVMFKEHVEKCTAIEHTTPSIIFRGFVFPAMLSALSVVLIVAGAQRGMQAQSESRPLKMAAIIFHILTGIVSMVLLWSPLWKYGITIVTANVIVLGGLQAPSAWGRRTAIVVAFVTLLYLVDPIANNSIFSFAGTHSSVTSRWAGDKVDAGPGGVTGQYGRFFSSGIQLAARENAAQFVLGGRDSFCTAFYDFFDRDWGTKDARHQNPQAQQWGLCRKGWRNTITVAAGLLTTHQIAFVVIALALYTKAAHSGNEQGAKIAPSA